MKPITFSQHAKEQLVFRGTTEEKVVKTIKTSTWEHAELGRLESRKDFTFKKKWNKKHYETKQVRPIFVDEEDEIVVITLYTYFF